MPKLTLDLPLSDGRSAVAAPAHSDSDSWILENGCWCNGEPIHLGQVIRSGYVRCALVTTESRFLFFVSLYRPISLTTVDSVSFARGQLQIDAEVWPYVLGKMPMQTEPEPAPRSSLEGGGFKFL